MPLFVELLSPRYSTPWDGGIGGTMVSIHTSILNSLHPQYNRLWKCVSSSLLTNLQNLTNFNFFKNCQNSANPGSHQVILSVPNSRIGNFCPTSKLLTIVLKNLYDKYLCGHIRTDYLKVCSCFSLTANMTVVCL